MLLPGSALALLPLDRPLRRLACPETTSSALVQTDSEYVVRIATGRKRGATQKCNEENADLWNEFETVLRLDDTRRLEFVWVKGHATKAHIDRQVTTTLNKGGDDAAGALTSVAAAHHAAPQTLTDAAHERQRTALITHSFASELLFRRRAALLTLHEADHGQLTDCAVVRDIPPTALSVHTHSFKLKYSQFQQVTDCTVRRH